MRNDTFDLLGLRDVICHVTIGFAIWYFLWVVNLNRPCILHGCWNIELQRFRGHDLDLIGSCDVISHVTTGLLMQFPICVPLNHRSISHHCQDIMRQTISQAYSRWKCIDLRFCVLWAKLGYKILQLFASSRSIGTPFELLTATIGPRASLPRHLDFPIEDALRGCEQLGQNIGRGHRILTPTKAFLLFGSPTFVQNFIKIEQKIATTGALTNRPTEGRKWFYNLSHAMT